MEIIKGIWVLKSIGLINCILVSGFWPFSVQYEHLSLWVVLGIPKLGFLPSFLRARWVKFGDTGKPIKITICYKKVENLIQLFQPWNEGCKVILLNHNDFKNFKAPQFFPADPVYTLKHGFPSSCLSCCVDTPQQTKLVSRDQCFEPLFLIFLCVCACEFFLRYYLP